MNQYVPHKMFEHGNKMSRDAIKPVFEVSEILDFESGGIVQSM